MSTARIPYRQTPTRLPLVEIGTLAPLLPRLRCSTCRGRLCVDRPTIWQRGRLLCMDCSREYNEVVDRLPAPKAPITRDANEANRGRPAGPNSQFPCDGCGGQRWGNRRYCQPCLAEACGAEVAV